MKRKDTVPGSTALVLGALIAGGALLLAVDLEWPVPAEAPAQKLLAHDQENPSRAAELRRASQDIGYGAQSISASGPARTTAVGGAFEPRYPEGEKVFQGLMSSSPTEAAQALDRAAQEAEALYQFDAICRRILELTADVDPLVAEHAEYAWRRMQALRIAHDLQDLAPLRESLQDPREAVRDGASDSLENAVEPFEEVEKRVRGARDPAVRLEGIEAAIRQDDALGFDLLLQALQGDPDPDNRLAAVSELEQMLKNGLGDYDQILGFLEETAADPDPRVAQLSELIVREQRMVHDEPSVPSQEETPADGGMEEEAQDLVELEANDDSPLESAEILLTDPNPAVRLGAQYAATTERDGTGVDLLSEAALADPVSDNRLSAVSNMEQMLNFGLGDRDSILRILEVAATDSDPRVAELSELILREQDE